MNTKHSLRKAWLEHVAKGIHGREEFSQKICKYLLKSTDLKKSICLAGFVMRAFEPDLQPLYEFYHSKLSFPKVVGNSLEFHTIHSMNDLERGYKGILEPKPEPGSLVVEWDLPSIILVPGFAFDSFGGRVGSGLGFYDRYLGGLGQDIQKWGICFHSQLTTQKIPLEPTDIKMDCIVTEKGILKCH